MSLKGPLLDTPLDRYYLKQLFSDERRYRQFIINFLTNSIKFTPAGGCVTVLLKVISVTEPMNISGDTALKALSVGSDESAPDKQMIEESKSENKSNQSQQ